MNPEATPCATERVPPRIRAKRVDGTRFRPKYLPAGLVLAVSVAAFFALRLVESTDFPLPRCGFRTVTGIPCPLCGTTHAAIALAHFNIVRALGYNPLMTLVLTGAALWLAVQLLRERPIGTRSRRSSCHEWIPATVMPSWSRPARWLFFGAFALNWIYLIVRLKN